jgi:ribosomal protein S17E
VPRQYHELEVLYKNTLVGHLDGIFYDEKTGTWWVVDYKSTSSRNVWKHKKYDDVFPYKTNKAQIMSYVPLIEKQLGKRISGYMLVYLPRDNPFEAKVVCVKHMGPKAKALELARLKGYVKAHRQALQVHDLKGFSSLYENKLCTSKKDYENNYENPYEKCPHLGYCFDKPKMLKHAQGVLKDTKLFPMLEQAPKAIRDELDL